MAPLLLSLFAFLVACTPQDRAVEVEDPTFGVPDLDLSVVDEPGDLRPEARAILAMAFDREDTFTLGDVAVEAPGALPDGFGDASAVELPATIRVWRMSEGSSGSCSGTVDVMPLEEYVRGVLPHEWIRSWETESLRAGAVAIRTYAAYWVVAGGKYDCADICDTTSCQVYDDDTYSVTDDAIADTEGKVAVEGGSLVFAEYSAENSDPTAYGVSEPYCTGEALYGHGRGMCQWGSQRWALYGGKGHDWMIEHYYPGAEAVVIGVDEDEDGYTTSEGDCDDDDPDVNPAADEYCDGIDNDCDGQTDESDAVDATTWYRDADGDGYGRDDRSKPACDAPDGWVETPGDCDDTDPAVHPGAVELCDGIDNDCDGEDDGSGLGVDEGFDVDGDRYRTCDGDCDDSDPSRHPGAPEVEDHVDNDCDWQVDEGSPSYDDDGDGWSEDDGDCDDADGFTYPGAPEMMDGGDDDCDGLVDEGTDRSDDDGDGYSEHAGDCDDADPFVHPGAPDAMDGLDGDCDGRTDEGTAAYDDDGDSFTELQGDCDDANWMVFRGAPELADGRDNDCDGLVDEDTDDFDDDGDGWAESDGDCDDANHMVHPTAPEALNGVDDDCDWLVDDHTPAWDDDHDGWTELEGDCDDADPAAHPAAAERSNDLDDDCDGVVDEGTDTYDDDGDGWTEAEGDCDDHAPGTFPGAPERLDGVDSDCDGLVDDETEAWDDDGDGWTELEGDCDDGNAHVNPAAVEALDGRDTDCDGIAEQPVGWGAGCAAGASGRPSVWLAVLALAVGPGRRQRRRRPGD